MHCSEYPKLVTVVCGAVYDIIVDLRKHSPTFRRWFAVVVSCENRRQLFIPANCGHGFLCLEDCKMLYLQGGCFNPSCEMDVSPFDPVLKIHWPILEGVPNYVMSEKDAKAPNLADIHGFQQVLKGADKSLRRILIIGASGQVGGALVEAFGEQHVIGTYSSAYSPGMLKFDLQDAAREPKLARDLLMSCRPEVVCICAGRTWVDGCENEGNIPHLVNTAGPREVVRAAKAVGATCVYFSTDYVFSGDEEGKLYKESMACSPVNVYGSTKLAGEKAVLDEDPTSLVIRTTGVFGPEKQGKNFVYQLCSAIAENRDMFCACDSFGCPTYNRDLAAVTMALLEARAAGIYHCVGPDIYDRYSFAKVIATSFGLDDKFIKAIDSQALFQNTVERLGFAACRGKHLALSTKKMQDAVPVACHPKSITAALEHWKDNPRGAACKF